MRNSTLFLVVCMFCMAFAVSTSNAQERPRTFMVMEEFVAPADMSAFWEAQNKVFEQFDKHQPDFSFWTYRTDESSFYWVMPLENFASLDAMPEKMNAFSKKMKEDGIETDKLFRDLSTMRHTFIYWREDLSYHPGEEMMQREDNTYCEWMFAYLKAGHEKEAAEAVKKYHEFYDGVDESYEWDVYQVIFGHDTPCWIFMLRAESELALRKAEDELGKKYDDEFQKMWQGFASHVRKFENRKGWFMPNWSRNWEIETGN